MPLFRPFVLGAALLVAPFASFAGALEPAAQAPSPGPADSEPWGYLLLLRTLQLYPLVGDEIEAGRLRENDIVLTSPRVSRRHAILRRGAEGIELVDIGSSNGTSRNGEALRPRAPVPLQSGDRIELADELLLFRTSLAELWPDELRHRLLSRIVKLRLHLPQDTTRKSLGREEIVEAVTEAEIRSDAGTAEVQHSVELDPRSGFPEGSGAFVGHVEAKDGALELSLWTITAGESMTSRRASFSNLKHATLSITIAEKKSDGTEEDGRIGPWFPPDVLAAVFEVFPDEPQMSLQFATSLATQDRSLALRDAATTLAFRHRLDPSEAKLLVMAARAKGLWIDRQIGERGLSLGKEEMSMLEAELLEAREWLSRARELGAEPELEVEDALARAGERLSRIQNIP